MCDPFAKVTQTIIKNEVTTVLNHMSDEIISEEVSKIIDEIKNEVTTSDNSETISEEISKIIDEQITNYNVHFAEIRYDLITSDYQKKSHPDK